MTHYHADCIIRLPQALLMHASLVFDDQQYGPAFRALQNESGNRLDPRHLLCLLLILEKAKGDASKWAPYISILPEQYDDPYWWNPNELQLLKGTRLGRAMRHYSAGLQQLAKHVQRLEQLCSSLVGAHGSHPLASFRGGWAYTMDAARWARSVVWSRAFTVRRLRDGTANAVAMVPVLDMIDHSPDVQVVWHTGRNGIQDFQFALLNGVPKGAVVYNNYGNKTSDELLLAYGFLVPNNPADFFHVALAHSNMPMQSAVLPGTEQLLPDKGSTDVAPGAGFGAAEHVAGVVGHSRQQEEQQQQPQHLSRMEIAEDGNNGSEDASADMPLESAALQQQAEELQRSLVLARLQLQQQHHLTMVQPLPKALVSGACICLMPPAKLYQLSCQLSCQGLAEMQAAAAAGGADGDVLDPTPHPLPLGNNGSCDSFKIGKGQKRPYPDSHSTAAAATVPAHGDSSDGASTSCPPMVVPQPTVQGQQQQQQQPPLLQELQVLVSIHQQLESKLHAMVSDTEAAQLTGLLSSDAKTSSTASAAVQGLLQTAVSHPDQLPQSLSRHAQLGLTYVGGQQQILRASMLQLQRRVSDSMHAAAASLPAKAVQCSPLQPGAEQPSETSRGHSAPISSMDGTSSMQAGSQQAAGAAGAAAAAGRPQQPSTAQLKHLGQYLNWLQQHGLLGGGCKIWECICRVKAPGGISAGDGMSQPAASSATAVGISTTSKMGASSARAPTHAPPATFNNPNHANSSNHSNHNPHTNGDGSSSVGQEQGLGCGRKRAAGTAAAKGSNQGQHVELPGGLGAALGLDIQHSPEGWGTQVLGAAAPGDVLLQVPAGCCLAAASPTELVQLLMTSAHRLVQPLLPASPTEKAAAAAAAARPTADGVPGQQRAVADGVPAAPAADAACCNSGHADKGPAHAADILILHLMHMVSASPAARLAVARNEGVQMLLEMLEDSPIGSIYQDNFETLQTDFQQLKAAAEAAAKSAAGGLSVQQQAMQAVASWPGAFGLYCWAVHVVERCAVQVQQDAGSSSSGSSWMLMPVVCAVPKELRDAALQVRWAAASSEAVPQVLHVTAACPLKPGLPLAPPVLLPFMDYDSIMSIYGPEAAALYNLLQTKSSSRTVLDPNDNYNSKDNGDRATAAATADHGMPQEAGTSSGSTAGARAGAAAAAGAAAGHVVPAPLGPGLLPFHTRSSMLCYEVFISPAEDDPFYAEKLQLLTAAGLGTVHYLTDQLDTELVLAGALKVCLAGDELLQHPLVHQCMQLYEALQMMKGGAAADAAAAQADVPGMPATAGSALRPGPSSAMAAVQGLQQQHHQQHHQQQRRQQATAVSVIPTAQGSTPSDAGPGAAGPAETLQGTEQGDRSNQDAATNNDGMDTDAIMVVGKATAEAAQQIRAQQEDTSAVPNGFLQIMHQTQVMLLDMLATLPADHSVSKAARKQLRQIVLDARKHAKRRLRQLEGVQADSLSRSRSCPLMRDGVKLYMHAMTTVLDKWADHLGLNHQQHQQQQHQYVKRAKTAHAKSWPAK